MLKMGVKFELRFGREIVEPVIKFDTTLAGLAADIERFMDITNERYLIDHSPNPCGP
jgi:hypothetical protein